jgi:hypothetical protein
MGVGLGISDRRRGVGMWGGLDGWSGEEGAQKGVTKLEGIRECGRGGFGPPKLSIFLLEKCSRERLSSCALPA